MALPTPIPGLVICYSYLWYDKYKDGHENGDKDRPCIILNVAANNQKTRIFLIPITHTIQKVEYEAIEIPDAVKKHLGLDSIHQWAVCSDLNEFDWSGPDIALIPNKRPKTCVYGVLPPKLFAEIRDRVVFIANKTQLRVVPRTA